MRKLSQLYKRMILVFVVFAGILALVACAPTERSEMTEKSTKETSTVSWSIESDCSVCHANQTNSFEDVTLTAAAHAGNTCFDCHTDVDNLAGVHKGVTSPPTRASRNSYTMASQETCLGKCHTSYKELAAATADSTAIVDLNGLVVNPHNVPASPGHLSDSKECYNCHTMHSEQQEAVEQYCRDCHHTNYYSSCTQCHE